MTALSEEKLLDDDDVEKTPPEIISNEDIPFHIDGTTTQTEDLSQEEDIDSKFNWKKLSIGSSALGWCIALMFFCVIISLFKTDNELVKDAFEAFKLIVLTVLGYIFGTNAKK